ncbi:DUF4254 domain-containing protein [Nocardia transvalensis]|uniref:DUF4254 domain-containing protein n=1 Tax=Nocardia transvalensis TaxID=37333 RepID=UPI0018931C87|nr:DUF4254 domain-containing protein [Nocardia transvalensis]MBF6333846.1 DUF4254 domain-containing protein [Nocardia transvalensis]
MASLPPKDLLLQACRGVPPGDDVVLQCACRLAELHEQRLTVAADVAEIDRHRAHLVHDIDRWVATQLPPASRGARLHTETVGTVIDRLAQFSALAYLALTTTPDWLVRDAWRRLSELAFAYDDLAAEVSAGLCRLPDFSGNREYEH